MFLFENTLIHYIYIVFYTLISRAHLAHKLGNFYATSRHATPTATPSPRSEQLPHHEQPHPNGIRAHNDRNTITNAPGNLHAMSNHTPERHPWRTPTTTPSPHRRGHIPVKSGLTASIPMGFSVGGPAAREWELTKYQFALTVKKLTRFLGFDLRIAVFGKFCFWYIYLEYKNIKTAQF